MSDTTDAKGAQGRGDGNLLSGGEAGASNALGATTGVAGACGGVRTVHQNGLIASDISGGEFRCPDSTTACHDKLGAVYNP